MAVKTLYATNTLVSNHQELSETSPGANATSSPNVGWVVGLTAPTVYSEFDGGTKQANGTFSATARPDGSINTAGDCLRSATTYSGSFASANWTLTFSVIGVTNSGAQDGRARFRLFRSVNADGSGATEITAAVQIGSTVTNLSTVQQDSAVTFNPGAFSLSNEYLFVQVGWEITGAGGMSTTDVVMRIGTTATRVVTSNFTAAYTLTAERGQFTLTGRDAGLLVGRQVVADRGLFSLTGGDMTGTVGGGAPTLTAESGSFTLVGRDVGLFIGRKVVADRGLFALVGNDAGLRWNHRIVAGAGAFVLTGRDVQLSKGFLIQADRGLFVLTGRDAQLRGPIRLTAEAGAFVLTGRDAALLRTYRLVAGAGAFTVTGRDAGLLWHRRLVAGAGAFSLLGGDAQFAIGKFLSLERGLFVLAGGDALLRRTHVLVAQAGAFALVGADAGLTHQQAQHYTLTAERGLFALAGRDVQLARGFRLQADRGLFALQGNDVGSSWTRKLVAERGLFVLTGGGVNLVAPLPSFGAGGRRTIWYFVNVATAPLRNWHMHGEVAVPTGMPEPLALQAERHPTSTNGILIQANPANTDYVYIGEAHVTPESGWVLTPGDSLFLPVVALELVYCIASTAGQKVRAIVV